MKTQIVKMMSRFRRDESGATIVEYGVALLIVIAIGTVTIGAIGGEVSSIFSSALAMLQAS
ncbi:MAG: Flp family type IVb pilin [Marivivens sp.]|nr:Flp family type IVb pilin [Marivivens sp.]